MGPRRNPLQGAEANDSSSGHTPPHLHFDFAGWRMPNVLVALGWHAPLRATRTGWYACAREPDWRPRPRSAAAAEPPGPYNLAYVDVGNDDVDLVDGGTWTAPVSGRWRSAGGPARCWTNRRRAVGRSCHRTTTATSLKGWG